MAQRNEPCPCGSGNKYKACCAVKRPRSQWVSLFAVVGFVVISGFVVASAFLGDGGERELPPGYVWSEEHGHAHRVGSEHVAIPNDAVWVPDHGHFHDADGNPVGGVTPTPDNPPAE